MNNMNMKAVKVNGNTREDLCIALSELGKMDLDFCGENGPEHLWENVDSSKYDNNMDYLLDYLKNPIFSDKVAIEIFIKRWLDSDSYYKDHILNVIYNTDKKAEYIALALLY